MGLGSGWVAPTSCSAELEYFPDGLGGEVALPPAVVTVVHFALAGRRAARVVLEASHPAAHVRVEVPLEGSWSDNGIFMRPGQPVNLTFTAAAPIVAGDDFVSSLSITSLADVVATRRG